MNILPLTIKYKKDRRAARTGVPPHATDIQENADILSALRRFRDKEYNCDKKV